MLDFLAVQRYFQTWCYFSLPLRWTSLLLYVYAGLYVCVYVLNINLMLAVLQEPAFERMFASSSEPVHPASDNWGT